MDVSAEEEIQQIRMGRPHVVLLGAGASRAAFPNGERNGYRLPVMADFMDIVPVGQLLEQAGIDYRGRNFEELYSELYRDQQYEEIRTALEAVIYEYFDGLQLPGEPSIYDHLLLSLRKKDVIATFNWDPFLILAASRNRHLSDHFPMLVFLHGNVAAGYCAQDNFHGVRGGFCPLCHERLPATRLLYPIGEKSYADEPAIADSWRYIKAVFEAAFMVTIFGYGAPQSDAGAVALLKEAWGGAEKRHMEQFEIIDIRPEDEVVESWRPFIHTHHYEYHTSFFDSWQMRHPRRTGEAYLSQYIDAQFIDDNRMPTNVGYTELWQWLQPLVQREKESA